MKSNEEALRMFQQKVGEHIAYFKRTMLTELERGLSADQMAGEIANQRFVTAVQADVRDFLASQEQRGAETRLSRMAAQTVASALTEPYRAAAFRQLAAAVRRRARKPGFAEDSKAYREAVAEFVEKYLRQQLERHFRMLEESLKGLGPILLCWREMETGKS